MKNYFFCFFILSLTGLLWAENEPFGNVTNKTGEVTVIRKFKKVLPTVKDVLLEKDLVKTAENSALDIEMGENNNIHIGEKSSIKLIKEKKDDKVEINLELMAGTVRCKLEKLEGQHFIVRSPTAVAGVRGTDFVTSFDPDLGPKAFAVTVFTGVVEVSVLDEASKAMGEATSVRPNQQIVVSNDGKSVAVSEVTPAKMETLRQQMPVKNDKMPEKTEEKKDEKKAEEKKDEKKSDEKKAEAKDDKKAEAKDDKKADNPTDATKKAEEPKANQSPAPIVNNLNDGKAISPPVSAPVASENPLVETTLPQIDLNLGAETAASSVDSIVQEQAAAAVQQVLDTAIQNVINDVQKDIERRSLNPDFSFGF